MAKTCAHAERFVQRRERDRGDGRRAVRVRDDAARPSARLPLPIEQRQVRGVDLGDDERHVRLHAEVLRVAQHERAGAGERRLELAGHAGIERREHDRRAQLVGVARQHRHVSERSSGSVPSSHRVASPYGLPADRSDAASSASSNHGWSREQPDERLADGAGGAEDGDGESASARRG